MATLHRTLAIVSSVGSVCELSAVTKFFNGNPVLGSLGAGIDSFSGRSGRKRWSEIAAVIGRNWDNVVDAIDEVVTTPEVDEAASEKAAAELKEPKPEPEEVDEVAETETEDAEGEESDADEDLEESEDAVADHGAGLVLGADEDFWHKVGIDPVQMMTRGGTFYTLRCYLDDAPVFLGRNGRVSVFGSERSLARYLADEHDHDLSDLATYDDIRTAATDGSLRVEVTEDNVYVTERAGRRFRRRSRRRGPGAAGTRRRVAQGRRRVRRGRHRRQDAGRRQPLGRLVAHVLDPETVRKPSAPYADAVEQWESLETFLESRLRPE